jgi:hypothetical protein
VATLVIGCLAALVRPLRRPIAAGPVTVALLAAATIAPGRSPTSPPTRIRSDADRALVQHLRGPRRVTALAAVTDMERPDLVSLPEAVMPFRADLG